MTIIRDNSEEFEAPFANQDTREEYPDTYKALTINFTSTQVEFLVDMWLSQMDANAEFFTNEEFQQMDELWNLIKPGIIPGKSINPESAA